MIVKRYLDNLGIKFLSHDYPKTCDCSEAKEFREKVKSVHTKSLFLKDKKSTRFFLVVMPRDVVTDLKKIENLFDLELRFATEGNLEDFLNLKPDVISPFGLMYDEYNVVEVVVHQDIWNGEKVNFFPNRKNELLELDGQDFQKFMNQIGNKIILF